MTTMILARTCLGPGCHADIGHKKSSAKFCSSRCASAHRRLDPLVQEQNRACTQAYRQAHPEEVRVRVAQWRSNHPEYGIQYRQQWLQKNPDKNRIHCQARRARITAASSFEFTSRDWSRLVNRFGGCCAYCGTKTVLHLEHVVPLSRGGSHGVGNFLPVCKTCNSSKRDRLLVEWRYR